MQMHADRMHLLGVEAIDLHPSRRTLLGLDWLNLLLADVQTGVGPFLAIYLASYHWNAERVGLALTVGGIAGIVTQAPAGALIDAWRSKRTIIAVGLVALAAGALLIARFPSFWPVMGAQVLIGEFRASLCRRSARSHWASSVAKHLTFAKGATRHSTPPAM